MKRIDRERVKRAVALMQDRTNRAERDAILLGERLFRDRRGPTTLYGAGEISAGRNARTSWAGNGDDPDNPAVLVKDLEATAAGCRWMLDRWAELRARLAPDDRWQAPDKLKAIRLLGRQPNEAADCADVGTIFRAAAILDPEDRKSAVDELKAEMWPREFNNMKKRMRKRPKQKFETRRRDRGATKPSPRSSTARPRARARSPKNTASGTTCWPPNPATTTRRTTTAAKATE